MARVLKTAAATVLFSALAMLLTAAPRPGQNPDQNEELLKTREMVWRAWFAGDLKALEALVPPDTIVMSGGEDAWKHQAEVLRTSGEFHAKGGKLLRLEFPRTEVQRFGNDVAIVWSSYVLETEMDGKRTTGASRVTEIFVRRNSHWTNPGWHTDPEK